MPKSIPDEEDSETHEPHIDTLGLFDNTSTAVIELDNTKLNEDSRIFDVLGREWKTDYANLPRGIYIIDGKKFFKN